MSKKILCVDDSPTQLRVMVKALEPLGYELFTAADGEEALEKAEKFSPDLILLDVVLPKRSGYQVCRHLKTQEGTKDIKILLVTSKSQASDRFWGLKQGADDYVTKPIDPAAMAEMVAQYLR